MHISITSSVGGLAAPDRVLRSMPTGRYQVLFASLDRYCLGLMRRVVVALCAMLLTCAVCAQEAPWAPRSKVLLIPLDDRPATTQFAQMIGQIAGADIETPPQLLLGRFTQPGDTGRIFDWLASKDLHHYKAVVLSTDMVAYGGLIASRVPRTPYSTAIARLRKIQKLRRAYPQVRFYAFSSIMRLAPTALRVNKPWRDTMTKFIALRAQKAAATKPDPTIDARIAKLRDTIPADEIESYDEARHRDHMVQQELIRMTAVKVFDYLILGQDDAQPVGPHVPETTRLVQMARNLKIDGRVYFCEGIDQHSNVLVSRALLTSESFRPRVRIVYADELGRQTFAPFEADRVDASLRDQLTASGAGFAGPNDQFDYSLYVNTPSPRPDHFATFVSSLQAEIDQGFPVAVADINLGHSGTGDPALFDALLASGRSVKLLAYAGWNTAGNTMGTAIPAANVYLLSRRLQIDPLSRELSQRAFLLHRLVNDFEYHRFTRPKAYALQAQVPDSSKEEVYGSTFDAVNNLVRNDLEQRLDQTFREQFQGRRFYAGAHQYEFSALKNVNVELPWPRAYEVRLGFQLEAQPVR